MPEYIVRRDKQGKGEQWLLNIGDSFVTLVAPDGRVLLEWTPENVANAVQFPSFSNSIKYVGFQVANMGMFQFSVNSATVKQLRAFANRGIATRGPGAVRAVLHKAILTCVGGGALMCGGLVLFAMTVHEITTGQSDTNGRPHVVGFVTAVSGFALLCRGIYGIYQYTQLKKVVATPA